MTGRTFTRCPGCGALTYDGQPPQHRHRPPCPHDTTAADHDGVERLTWDQMVDRYGHRGVLQVPELIESPDGEPLGVDPGEPVPYSIAVWDTNTVELIDDDQTA